MHDQADVNDAIAAVCTAPGAAGLAVLRVSGPAALAIAGSVFRGGLPLGSAASHTLHHGWAWAPGSSPGAVETAHASESNGRGEARRLDEVIAAVFRAPRSYTGEDVVELSCHGGRISCQRVLDALIAAGARLAAPGEFTLRAFLNGRIDLAQAEAVADVIHAESEAAHELALAQLAGALSRRLERASERIADALAEVEARVDFAEDVGGVEVPSHVVMLIADLSAELRAMLASAAWGRALRDGVQLPLVGHPNVGKSSLFNALVGEERAIVTTLPGTTRDRVSEAVEIAGVRVTLSDTAGLRATADAVEAIGVRLARETLDRSRAVLWVVDGSAPLDPEARRTAGSFAGKRVLAALNKRDLGAVVPVPEIETLLAAAAWRRVVEVSATQGTGIEELRQAIIAMVGAEAGGRNAPPTMAALSNPRHVEALRRAQQALDRAAGIAAAGEPGELVALELRDCLEAIGEVTGRSVDADLLDRIFGKFCIGK